MPGLLNPEIDYTPTPYDSWEQLTKDYYNACKNSNDPISYEQGSALDAIVVEAKNGTYQQVTQAERLTMSPLILGRHVYQTDGTEGVYIYKSTGWVFAY